MRLGEDGVKQWLYGMPPRSALLITSLRNYQNRWRILIEKRKFWNPFNRYKQIRLLLKEYMNKYSPAREKKFKKTLKID